MTSASPPAPADAPIAAFIAEILAAGVQPHSLQIRQDGEVLLDRYVSPYTAEDAVLVYSISKSFTAAAAGLAIGEGRFAVTDRVLDLLPQYADADLPEAVRQYTLHHLLSMSTGHTEDTLAALTGDEDDPALAILRVPPQQPPGCCHVYNNGATFLLGLIVQQHTGQRLVDYLRPRLFDPLGVGPTWWDRVPAVDAAGRPSEVDMGFTGLHLRPDGLARFAQLLLDDGVWQGRRLLPQGWVALASTNHIPTTVDAAKPDWSQGYGYQFWMATHGWRGDGAHGQFCLVLPEQNAAVAMTSLTEDMQVVLDAFWRHVLPALDAHGPLDDPGPLSLPAASSTAGPGDSPLIEPTSQGHVVAWTEDGDRLRLAVGDGRWHTGVLALAEGELPVAASGGWRGPQEFDARVLVLTSPQSLSLRVRGNELSWSWDDPPPLRGDNKLSRMLLT